MVWGEIFSFSQSTMLFCLQCFLITSFLVQLNIKKVFKKWLVIGEKDKVISIRIDRYISMYFCELLQMISEKVLENINGK